MKPVFQTRFGPDGNCYRACVASILEAPLEEVPEFRGEGWGMRLREWLKERGFWALFLPPSHMVSGCAIKSIRTPRGQPHAVVCLDGKVIHDPHGRPLWQDDSPVLLWTVIEEQT